jgi:plastocyanin
MRVWIGERVAAVVGLAFLTSCGSSTSPSGNGAGGGGGGGAAGATASVAIQSYAFNPTPDTVLINTTVTWTNKDPETHTVTADGGSSGTWDSGNLVTGSAFTYKFQVRGKYTYHCAIHPTMSGTILVK